MHSCEDKEYMRYLWELVLHILSLDSQ